MELARLTLADGLFASNAHSQIGAPKFMIPQRFWPDIVSLPLLAQTERPALLKFSCELDAQG